MTDSTRRGLGLIGISLLLGVLGDALLRQTPWGFNVPLWLALAVIGGWALLPAEPGPRRLSPWPIAAALMFASFLAWRDSPFLQFWNTVAILAALTLPILESKGVRLGLARVSDYARGAAATFGHTIRGLMAPLAHDVAWGELHRYRHSAGAVAIGTTLAVPAVLVFGMLLASADQGFATLTGRFVRFDIGTVFSHTFLTAGLAWITAGYISPLLAGPAPVQHPGPLTGPKLGIVEVATPLAAVAILFVTFIGVQIGYLFGGENAMLAAGMTYAQYARDGFVQLVAAAALVLPMLLVAHWLFEPANARHTRLFNFAATTLIGLVGLLMVSALHRVTLYVGQYGLTEIRLYASVFLGWIGLVQVAFLTTVLAGSPERFAFRSVLSGLGVLALLNVSNPEALIARSQIARGAGSAELDVSYLSSLSADAIPAIMAHLHQLSAAKACDWYHGDLANRRGTGQTDWRSWNLARARARALIRAADGPVRASCVPSRSG